MRRRDETRPYPVVGSYEFEEWANKQIEEINELISEYRKSRLDALCEFAEELEKIRKFNIDV